MRDLEHRAWATQKAAMLIEAAMDALPNKDRDDALEFERMRLTLSGLQGELAGKSFRARQAFNAILDEMEV